MPIEKVNDEVYSQCRIPGIVITENGGLFFKRIIGYKE